MSQIEGRTDKRNRLQYIRFSKKFGYNKTNCLLELNIPSHRKTARHS